MATLSLYSQQFTPEGLPRPDSKAQAGELFVEASGLPANINLEWQVKCATGYMKGTLTADKNGNIAQALPVSDLELAKVYDQIGSTTWVDDGNFWQAGGPDVKVTLSAPLPTRASYKKPAFMFEAAK
jgi:hypothetical protein